MYTLFKLILDSNGSEQEGVRDFASLTHLLVTLVALVMSSCYSSFI